MSKPKVSIVILGYNRKDDIREVLNHLREQTYTDFETIVVDNASTDSSVEMIESDFAEVRLIRLGKNYGIPAYNKGFEIAIGEIIITLNNDSYPATDTIKKIVDIFDTYPRLGILQGRIINVSTRTLFYPPNEALRKKTTQCDFVVAGAAIRKEIFNKIGYFPKSVFLFGAEHDLSLRALSARYKIKYFDEVIFYHLHKPDYLHSLFDPTYYHIRSYYWIIWRRYPPLKAIDSTLGLFFVLLRKGIKEKRLYTYFVATVSAFLKLPIIIKERTVIEYKYIKMREEEFGTFSLLKRFKRM